jgi:hypothetical protein
LVNSAFVSRAPASAKNAEGCREEKLDKLTRSSQNDPDSLEESER